MSEAVKSIKTLNGYSLEDTEAREGVAKAARRIDTVSFVVGENLINNETGVVLGTNWAGDAANGYTHEAGSTEPLTIQVATEEGAAYYIDWAPASSSEASLFVAIGDTPGVDTYKGTDLPSTAIISDGGYLIFTPEKEFAGTIHSISIRKIGTGEKVITKELINHDTGTMTANISGFWNVALGQRALQTSVNGSRNIAIGNQALRTLVTGTRNVSVGTFALCYLQYGERNIAIGADSLWLATHADDCIAIGMAAMSTRGTAETDLKECIAIGRDAMHNCKDDAKNVIAIGRYAGTYAYKQDVFVGTKAGYRSGGTGNTAIGDQSFASYAQGDDGARDPDTGDLMGDYNSFFGKGADVADTKTAKYRSTAIGYNAKVDKSDQMVLGGDNVKETVVKGDMVVRGTDGVMRRIVFLPGEEVPVGDAQLFDYTTAETSQMIPQQSTMVTASSAVSRTWIIPYSGKANEKISFNTFADTTELGVQRLYFYVANEKPDIAGSTVLQIGSVSTTNMRGNITPTMDYQYIAVSFGLSAASETAWNEIAKGLTVQKGNYATEYTSYYKSEAGTVAWEAVN